MASGNQNKSYVKRLITNFDQAAQSYAFKGAQMPELHDKIEQDYKQTREKLEEFIFSQMER